MWGASLAVGRHTGVFVVGAIGAVAIAVGGYFALTGSSDASSKASSLVRTASISGQSRNLGKSGLPVPRFVTLKTAKVNVRRGPSNAHKVAWVFNRKGLPVEIIAEFDNWRRVRDSEGAEGWIYQSLLSGRRNVVVSPWKKNKTVPLLAKPAPRATAVALLSPGVIAGVESCTGTWCRINAGGYRGWVAQSALWGVYPGEAVKAR